MKHSLPDTGFMRLNTILKLIPVGKSTWWKGVKSGRFPKPIKLGPRTTAWRTEDIQKLIQQYSAYQGNPTLPVLRKKPEEGLVQ